MPRVIGEALAKPSGEGRFSAIRIEVGGIAKRSHTEMGYALSSLLGVKYGN